MKTSPKTYIFEVILDYEEKVMRQIEIIPSNTLADLAHTILHAYDFDVDHAYGFYDHFDRGSYIRKAKRHYELFHDLHRNEGRVSEGPGVERTRIYTLWNMIGITWYFLFDYGDDWVFHVKLIKQDAKQADRSYPRIITKEGKAPQQYPDWDDEEEFDKHTT